MPGTRLFRLRFSSWSGAIAECVRGWPIFIAECCLYRYLADLIHSSANSVQHHLSQRVIILNTTSVLIIKWNELVPTGG
jgi:hypothetical protein